MPLIRSNRKSLTIKDWKNGTGTSDSIKDNRNTHRFLGKTSSNLTDISGKTNSIIPGVFELGNKEHQFSHRNQFYIPSKI